jgi:O-succinylbenzoate synthase
MADLCRNSPIPIALDEELNGKPFDHQKFNLLEAVEPQFVVLKPSLLGGLGQTNQWISMAEDLGIDWWITSMLESNVGLNAIAQLAGQYRTFFPQGLGTGQLYHNNISSPLSISEGEIFIDPAQPWQSDLK